MDLSERMGALGKRCRHYNSLLGVQKGEDCGIGHPIRKIVTAANGGDSTGMAFMLPCRPGPDRKAECPSYDPKTDDEIAIEKAARDAEIDRFVARLPKIAEMKRKMIANRLSTAKATCPWCEEVDAFKLSCAVDYNQHVHGKCAKCGMGFLE